MKILVTGGTGFIGRHLVKKLVANGHKVRCLVRENSQTDALKKLGVELVYGDISETDSLEVVAKDIDTVYHLAAIADNRQVRSDQMHHVSLNGTGNLVKACLKRNVKKFIYFSSISAIGARDAKNLWTKQFYAARPQSMEKESWQQKICSSSTLVAPASRSISSDRRSSMGAGTNTEASGAWQNS